ncbi:MAG TPA: Hpt domain-containing protein [Geomonas sp.]|nr:Hpt domain-containing protein [Geomonas sp.]
MPQRYLRIFCAEAEAHLTSLRSGLLVLEKNPASTNLLHELLRNAHTLKGAALMVGVSDIATITDKVEEQLKRMASGAEPIDDAAIDLLFKGIDAITLISTALSRGAEPQLDVKRFLAEYRVNRSGRASRRETREGSCGQLSETARAAFRTFESLQQLIAEMGVKKQRLEGRLSRIKELARWVAPNSEAVLGRFRLELEDDLLYLDYLIQELHDKACVCPLDNVRDFDFAGAPTGRDTCHA